MSGKILSDKDRAQIVKDIHQSYNKEVQKMIKLSDEECKKIAEEVHRDFEEVLKKVAKDSEYLNNLARKKAEAKAKQEKEEAKLLQEMKPSVIRWFLNLFGG